MKSITNNVFLRGKVSSEFQFSHNENKDCYYMSEIEIKRTSGYTDRIPVMVSNKTYILPKVGSHVCVKGHFHSYKQNITGRNRLMLKVLALEIMYWNKKAEETDENRIYLDGFICKQPVCRKTPMGRYIADVCVAVNLSHNHSDYLPCIFWGKMQEMFHIFLSVVQYSYGDEFRAENILKKQKKNGKNELLMKYQYPK